MALERTFAIIKPDAVGRGLQGEILSRVHKAGFTIVAIKTMRLTKQEAGGFYAVHRERPFFGELTDFMSSGKIIAMVLEADAAITKWRDTMGATDPKKAAPGTIRRDLGASIGNNCTHGSDAPDTAAFSSALPPISPIRMIACVSGSSLNILMASRNDVPIMGSPPIPMQVD